MIEKNDIICATTDAIGSNGEGIIKHEGITFFVPACLPGEKVCFKIAVKKAAADEFVTELVDYMQGRVQTSAGAEYYAPFKEE